jgi:hypothetical protein
VTTTRHGGVSDVFQVSLDPGGTVTPDDIKIIVEAAVFGSQGVGEKKRRAEPED